MFTPVPIWADGHSLIFERIALSPSAPPDAAAMPLAGGHWAPALAIEQVTDSTIAQLAVRVPF